MRHLILCSLLLACGGDPFGGENAVGAGGDDSVLAGAGGDSSDVGGAVSVAGKTSSGGSVSVAGAPAGGGNVGGGAHAGASTGGQGGAPAGGASGSTSTAGTMSGGTGGGVSTCALDTAKLTAALPATLVWQDFTATSGEGCFTCRDKPCGTTKVLSWGMPQEQPDGTLLYLPNTDKPMIPINFGANDGSCTKKTECGIKMNDPSLTLTVERSATGWVVTRTQSSVGGYESSCAVSQPGGFAFRSLMEADFSKEVNSSINGLKIPCPG